jgi:hypothetical protein
MTRRLTGLALCAVREARHCAAPRWSESRGGEAQTVDRSIAGATRLLLFPGTAGGLAGFHEEFLEIADHARIALG